MPELNQTPDATVPAQREAVGPVKKSTPVVLALIAIVALIGIANISSLVSGKKKSAPASALPMRPSTANAQQVSSFETMQSMQARKDNDDRQRQQELAAEMQQLQQEQAVPGPEADGTPKMTAAQRDAIYGNSSNAPKQTSNVSQAQAEAKQKVLEREKVHQDAVNSDTVAIDFSHPTVAAPGSAQATAVLGQREEMSPTASAAKTSGKN
jgi:Tfp pilus assembly protein FimT